MAASTQAHALTVCLFSLFTRKNVLGPFRGIHHQCKIPSLGQTKQLMLGVMLADRDKRSGRPTPANLAGRWRRVLSHVDVFTAQLAPPQWWQ